MNFIIISTFQSFREMKFAFAATLLVAVAFAQEDGTEAKPDEGEVCPLVTLPDGTVIYNCPEEKEGDEGFLKFKENDIGMQVLDLPEIPGITINEVYKEDMEDFAEVIKMQQEELAVRYERNWNTYL